MIQAAAINSGKAAIAVVLIVVVYGALPKVVLPWLAAKRTKRTEVGEQRSARPYLILTMAAATIGAVGAFVAHDARLGVWLIGLDLGAAIWVFQDQRQRRG